MTSVPHSCRIPHAIQRSRCDRPVTVSMSLACWGNIRPGKGHPLTRWEYVMPYTVDFSTVSTVGLESSPVAAALAGLRANEARYFRNKYDHVFTVEPAAEAKAAVDWVHGII